MNISVFGLGYVGCVSVGCLANDGHTVIGVDRVESKVDLINMGRATIVEKDIDDIVATQFAAGRISATTDFNEAVLQTDVSIICVGTPSGSEGHLSMQQVLTVAGQIGASLALKDGFHVVVIRSTVLPGTARRVQERIAAESARTPNEDFAVVVNPEFLREGSAVEDYYNPALTVLASENVDAIDTLREVYANVPAPVEIVEIEVAELIKFVGNSFHALKVSFANEVGNICKKLGVDSHRLMDLFCKDYRLNISPTYLTPGFAYGGSCLPKDLKALTTLAHDLYLSAPVLSAIEPSNSVQKDIAYSMIMETGFRKVSILGLSFKAGTDDLRYSPIVEVAERLLGKGFSLKIFDDNVNLARISGTNRDYVDNHIPHLSDLISSDLESVIEESEVIVITQRRQLFEQTVSRYPDKVIIDLARIQHSNAEQDYRGICW